MNENNCPRCRQESNLAERCYYADSAIDELYNELVRIVSQSNPFELLKENKPLLVEDVWVDSYDSSVEVVMQFGVRLTREQADAILDLGFAQIYETYQLDDEKPKGWNWSESNDHSGWPAGLYRENNIQDNQESLAKFKALRRKQLEDATTIQRLRAELFKLTDKKD